MAPSKPERDSNVLPIGRRSGATASAVRPSLRQRILDAACASLVENGVARTTTVEVQRRAGVSRGALLHHFATHAQLLAASIDELVRRNERAVDEMTAALEGAVDGVGQGVRALAFMTSQPAFRAELELWAAARVDPDLLASLAAAERRAKVHRDRVVRALFASAADRPGHQAVCELTMEFMNGLALSSVLRRSPARRQRLIAQWERSVRILLEHLR